MHYRIFPSMGTQILVLTILGEHMDLKLDIELLTTQPILQIRQPTAKDISDLHWNELTSPADWDTYFPFYNEK